MAGSVPGYITPASNAAGISSQKFPDTRSVSENLPEGGIGTLSNLVDCFTAVAGVWPEFISGMPTLTCSPILGGETNVGAFPGPSPARLFSSVIWRILSVASEVLCKALSVLLRILREMPVSMARIAVKRARTAVKIAIQNSYGCVMKLLIFLRRLYT